MKIEIQNLLSLSAKEHNALLEIRNSEYVRLKMRTMEIIDLESHLNWIKGLKRKNIEYYAIKNNGVIVGSINLSSIDYIKCSCELGFYFLEDICSFIVFLSVSKLIDRVFNSLRLKKIVGEVKKSNKAAFRFDKRIGFEVCGKIERKGEEDILLVMTKEGWVKKMESRFMKNILKYIYEVEIEFKEEELQNFK